MGRKTNATNSAITEVAVETTATSVDYTAEENMKEEVKKTVKVEPLKDSDEIEVISLIPNVSYKDSHTNDYYEWEKVGHKELMTFETLRNLWRNHKSYFRNMWLKPCDDRVISKFGLESLYKKHEFLMDKSSYTRTNINKVCEEISGTPNGMKFAICNRVKSLVIAGEITDIAVIRALEKHLNLELISFLN